MENQFIVNEIEVSLRSLRFPIKGNIKITITMFRAEATSAFAARILEFGDVENIGIWRGWGKLESPEKHLRSKARTNDKRNPHMALSWIRTPAKLVGGECSHHWAMPTPRHETDTQFSFIYKRHQLIWLSGIKIYKMINNN